jgi:hypothetical protein
MLQAQTVPRDKVVVEIGTGTWCYYCPGAAMGADDLIANGKQVAIIEYHGGGSDPFINSYSTARINYYGLGGYPTAYFDGGNAVEGGNHTQSMYSSYLAKYNQRIGINSAFTIQILGTNVGNNYSVNILVTKVATYTGPNPILHLVLTQSNIQYSWQGMTHVNFVERLMVPNQNGTTISFASGDVQGASLSFTKDASWPLADCELVAFLQNNTSKEILQGTKVALNELQSEATDAALISVYNVPVMSCSGKAAPFLKIKNITNANLLSAIIKYKINNGQLLSYAWSGILGINQESLFQLPQMTFTPSDENVFTAYIQTANGGADPNSLNDTIQKTFSGSENYYSTINLELKTDNNPQQTTWQVLNSNNQVVFSGGPYTGQPNTVIQVAMNFVQSGCYRFIISDSGNDGLCCTSGNGYFTLKDINNQLIYSNGDFGPKETVDMGIDISIFDLWAFLEGPFNIWSFDMQTTLNQQGVIPLAQPYNTSPWNYAGSEIVPSIPGNDIVDWVLVELRETSGGPETATSSTTIARQAAFITNYGKIVDIDGMSNLRFNLSITGNLFIVMHHRNHLSIMNAEALPYFGGIYYFDFTASTDYIYGGQAGCKNLYGSSIMAAGDGNGDGVIDLSDKNVSWSADCGKKGYIQTDLNLNQQVNNQDKLEFWRLNYSMQSQVPD